MGGIRHFFWGFPIRRYLWGGEIATFIWGALYRYRYIWGYLENETSKKYQDTKSPTIKRNVKNSTA